MLGRDGGFVRPHRHSGSADAKGVGKGLLGAVCGDGFALVDVHAPIVRPLTPAVNPLTRAKRKITDMGNSSLAARAQKARIRAGFAKEADAALAIGCSRTLVIAWENGDAKSIGGKYLLPAARAYKVRPEWLSDGAGVDGYPWGEGQDHLAPLRESHPLQLDPVMLAETHRALRELEEEMGRPFSIEDEDAAARFVQVYAIRADMPAQPTQEQWIQFGRKLATITSGPRGPQGPQGAIDDGRSNGVPAQGTGAKGMAGRLRRKA